MDNLFIYINDYIKTISMKSNSCTFELFKHINLHINTIYNFIKDFNIVSFSSIDEDLFSEKNNDRIANVVCSIQELKSLITEKLYTILKQNKLYNIVKTEYFLLCKNINLLYDEIISLNEMFFNKMFFIV